MIATLVSYLPDLFAGTAKYLTVGTWPAPAALSGLKRWTAVRSSQGFTLCPHEAEISGKQTEPLGALPAGFAFVLLRDNDDDTWRDMLLCVKAAGLPSFGLPLIRAGSDDVPGRAVTIMTQALGAAQHRNGELTSALAVLRQEHQESRALLAGMQNLLHAGGKGVPEIAVATSTGPVTTGDSPGPKIEISQRLLLAPAGIAALDLHVAVPPDGQGEMTARLAAADDDTMLGLWVIDYAALRPGWLHLALPVAIETRQPYADLILTLQGASGMPPSFSLAAERYAEAVSVKEDGDTRSARTLAMRIWIGQPGVRTPTDQGVAAAWAASTPGHALPPHALRTAVPAQDYVADFECVAYLPGKGILVHPLCGQSVTALLHGALPTGTIRVEADTFLPEDAVSDVEFALGAALPSQLPETAVEGTVHSSGWMRQGLRNVPERIVLPIVAPLAEPMDLVLSTRVAGGGSVDFARAVFSRIVLHGKMTVVNAAEAGDTKSRAESLVASRRKEHETLTKPFLIGPDALQAAIALYDIDLPFRAIQQFGNSIIVHPVAGRIFGVSVPLPQVNAVLGVSARLGVHHNFPNTVQFRLALGHDEKIGLDRGEESLWGRPSTAWLPVTSRSGEHVHHWTLARPAEARFLYLMTRVPDGGSVDFALAYFSEIEVEPL